MASSDETRGGGAGAARMHRTPAKETSFGAIPSVSQPGEEEEIRLLAFEYFQARGGEPGHAEEDWTRAEQEVRRRRSSQQGGPSAPEEAGQGALKRGAASSSKTSRTPGPVAAHPAPGARGTPQPQTRGADNRLEDGSVGNPNVTRKPKR